MTIAVQLENLEGLKRKVTIEMPWDEINTMADEELKKVRSKVKLNGFRPGKVPEKVIRERYGAAIQQESMYKVIDKELKQAFKDKELNVVEVTKIEPEQMESSAPFKFSAWFEVLPEIAFKSLDGQVIKKRVSTIEEKDIDEVLTRLQNQFKEWVDVDRAAALNDKLVIDFIGYRDGEPFAGGKAEGSELVLGSKQFIPGFEDSLVGVKAGDKKTISVTFPEKYHQASLAGVPVTFDVTVHKVLEGKVRALDDEFATLLGIKEGGMEGLRKELRQGLERELAVALREENKKRVLTKLKELNAIDVPDALISEEIERIVKVIEAQSAKQKHKMHINDKTQFATQARDNVTTGLLMREAVKAFNLKVEASHVRALLEEKMSAYENPTQMMQMYYNSQALLEQIQGEAMEGLIVDALLNTAKIEEEVVPYEEAIRGEHHHDHAHDHDHDHEHCDHDHHDHDH